MACHEACIIVHIVRNRACSKPNTIEAFYLSAKAAMPEAEGWPFAVQNSSGKDYGSASVPNACHHENRGQLHVL